MNVAIDVLMLGLCGFLLVVLIRGELADQRRRRNMSARSQTISDAWATYQRNLAEHRERTTK